MTPQPRGGDEFDSTVPRRGSGRRESPGDPGATIPNPRRTPSTRVTSRAADATVRPSGRASRAEGTRPQDPAAGTPTIHRPVDVGRTATSVTAGFHRYQLGDELGRGGIGVVHSADDPVLRREIAIKTLLRVTAAETASFVEEAQITGQLEHPNIVPIHELGTDANGRPYLAMKRVEGRTLRDIVTGARSSRNRWSDDSSGFLETFGKVCDAIAYAHSRGVLHRDLKPENIMVGEYGEVLVMDWGLAKPLATPESERHLVTSDRRVTDGELTLQGDVFGTPAYMPPEQARGDVHLMDERADVFSLGGILYALATLQPPYSSHNGRGAREVLARAAAHDLVPPRRRAPGRRIPKELEAIILMAMAQQPSARYASAAALKADLHAHQASRPVVARRDPLLTRIVKWSKRHPTAALGSSLCLVFAMVVGLLLVQLQTANRLADSESARRADAERIAQERQQLLRRMRAGDYDFVLGQLEQQVRGERDRAIEEFKAAYDARPAGQTEQEFIDAFGTERLNAAIAAFDRLFEQHEKRGIAVTADDYFYRALLRGKTDDQEAAIADLTRAIDLNPRFSSAYHNRGVAYADLGKLEEAIADYDRAIGIRPRYLLALHARALARERAGDRDGALADFDRTLAIDPDFLSALVNRGHSRSDAGDLAGSLADFNRAVALAPDGPLVVGGRGVTRHLMGDLDGAIADFTRAIELDQTYAIAWMGRARVRYEKDDAAGAINDYDRALELRPDFIEAWINRGIARKVTGDRTGAIADFTRAIELDPDDPNPWTNRGSARKEDGDLDGALADYDRAIAIDSGFADAWYNRGNLRVAQKEYGAAIADFDEALRLQPDRAEAWSNRGAARRANGDAAGAIEDFNRALEVDAGLFDAWLGRGNARKATGDLAGAIADYDRALAIDPDDARTWYNRGNTELDRNNPAIAIANYDAALRIRPGFVEARFNRGGARKVAGDLDGAVADFTRVLELRTDFVEAWVSRGNILRSRGDHAGAIEDYNRAIAIAPHYWLAWLNRGMARVDGSIDRAAGLVDLQEAYRRCPPARRSAVAGVIRQRGGEVPE